MHFCFLSKGFGSVSFNVCVRLWVRVHAQIKGRKTRDLHNEILWNVYWGKKSDTQVLVFVTLQACKCSPLSRCFCNGVSALAIRRTLDSCFSQASHLLPTHTIMFRHDPCIPSTGEPLNVSYVFWVCQSCQPQSRWSHLIAAAPGI